MEAGLGEEKHKGNTDSVKRGKETSEFGLYDL